MVLPNQFGRLENYCFFISFVGSSLSAILGLLLFLNERIRINHIKPLQHIEKIPHNPKVGLIFALKVRSSHGFPVKYSLTHTISRINVGVTSITRNSNPFVFMLLYFFPVMNFIASDMYCVLVSGAFYYLSRS